MATDYIMFIHGVNVRDRKSYEQDAMRMFERIKASLQDQFIHLENSWKRNTRAPQGKSFSTDVYKGFPVIHIKKSPWMG